MLVELLDNALFWTLFASMVWLRYGSGWFKPKFCHTDRLLEVAIAMPFNYLSSQWTLEALIVLLSWWLYDEWHFQRKGRTFREQVKLTASKLWG